MKKIVCFICSLFLFSTITIYAQSVDLNTAIKNGAVYFEQNLQRGTTIAVLSIKSDHTVLSEYVIDELSSYLVNGRIFTVVDRQNLDTIQREQNYQLSGEVSDETAQSIGKRIGAQTVITGTIQTLASEYLLVLRALSVETGVIQGIIRQDIADDNRIRALIGAPFSAGTAPGREPRIAGPRAGGSKLLINAGSGYSSKMTFPPISASFDYLFPGGPSLGIYAAYINVRAIRIFSTSGTLVYQTGNKLFALSARAAWNFNLRQNIIPYAGLLLGYIIGNEEVLYNPNSQGSDLPYSLNSFSFGANIGIRYFFTTHIGAYVDTVINYGPFASRAGEYEDGYFAATLGLALKF